MHSDKGARCEDEQSDGKTERVRRGQEGASGREGGSGREESATMSRIGNFLLHIGQELSALGLWHLHTPGVIMVDGADDSS